MTAIQRLLKGRVEGLMLSLLLASGLSVIAQEVPAPTAEIPVSKAKAPDRKSAHEYLRAGDQAYKRQDYAAAELAYRRASEREPSFKSLYNLGLSLSQQGRPAEAAEAFERAERFAEDLADQVDANYNAGTAQLQAENLQESVQRYVDALKLNPNDLEAKQNLSEVLKQLRLQQTPPPEQQQSQDEQQKSDQEENSEENQQQQEQQQEKNEQEDSSTKPSDQDQEQQKEEGAGKPGKEVDVDREEAERLLQLARDQERKTQEKLKLDSSQPNRPAKDW